MNATPMVAAILAIFGLGLPAYVLIKAFRPGFFAREDTRTPMIFAAISVVTNISLALYLLPRMGAPGIAVASAVSAWINAALLFGTLVKRGHWGTDRTLLKRLPRLVAAAFLMGVALWFAADWLAPWLQPCLRLPNRCWRWARMCGGGAALYFALAFATGGADIATVKRAVRRGPKTPERHLNPQ